MNRIRVHSLNGDASAATLETWLNSYEGRLVALQHIAGAPRKFNELGPTAGDPGVFLAVFDHSKADAQ